MVMTNEDSFPRGGGKTRPAHEEKTHETFNIFGRQKGDNKKGKKKKHTTENESEFDPTVVNAELLTHKLISDDQLILGCVSEIREYEVILSLPGRTVGKLPLTRISSPYTNLLQQLTQGSETSQEVHQLKDMFKVGQYLVVRVVEIERSEKSEVTVSTMPQHLYSSYSISTLKKGLVLQLAVKSVEDHGYIMESGIKSLRAFLTFEQAEQYKNVWNEGRSLAAGQLVPCLIKKVETESKTTTITITADPSKVAKAIVKDKHGITVETLMPGMKVLAIVEKPIKDGLKVTFLDKFTGIVNQLHFDSLWKSPSDYEVGSAVNAHILYVIPLVRTVHLSIMPSVNSASPCNSVWIESGFGKGSVIDTAKVERVSRSGIFLRICGNSRSYAGFVSLNNISDRELPEDLKEAYKVGSIQKCRIVQYDYMDRLFICSMKKSSLTQPFIQIENLKAGQIISCEVDQFLSNGLLVSVGYSLKGFIPTLHLADVHLRHPEQKFKKGMQIKGRVLLIVPELRKLHITLKKGLVESKLQQLTSYEKATVGTTAEGTVVKVDSQGVVVSFYNDVKGFMATHLGKHFCVGQVVRCKVHEVIPERKKMQLKLTVPDQSSSANNKGDETDNDLVVGKTYVVEVVEVTSGSLKVVEVNSRVKGVIPKQHLTDHKQLSDMLLETYKCGEEIKDALLFSKVGSVIFSMKPSLIDYFNDSHVMQEFEDLQIDQILPCVVHSIKSFGVFVYLPVSNFRRRGLVPVGLLTNGFVDSIESLGLVEYETLFARVSRINPEAKEVSLSSKLTNVWNKLAEPGIDFLVTYLEGMCRISKHYAASFKIPPIGQEIKAKVKEVTSDGAVLEIAPGLETTVAGYHMEGVTLSKGQSVTGAVLCIDGSNSSLEVDVTLRPELVSRLKYFRQGVTTLALGIVVQGEAVVIKPDFVIVCASAKKFKHSVGQLIYVPTRLHLNDFRGRSSLFTLGADYKLVVVRTEEGRVIGMIKANMKVAQNRSILQSRIKLGNKRLQKESAYFLDSLDNTGKKKKPKLELKRRRTDSQSSLLETQNGEPLDQEGDAILSPEKNITLNSFDLSKESLSLDTFVSSSESGKKVKATSKGIVASTPKDFNSSQNVRSANSTGNLRKRRRGRK